MGKLFIIVIGLPGSGKGEASRVINGQGIPLLRFGEIVKEATLARGLPYTIKNSEETAVLIRKKYGPFVIPERLWKKMKKLDSDVFCLDGARDLREMEYLEKKGKIILIVVESSEKMRYERNKKRKDSRDPQSFEDFKWRDKEELDRGLRNLINTGKYERVVIKNDSDLETLKKRVLEVFEEIMDKHAQFKLKNSS